MARFERVRTRPISVIAALLLVVLSIGVSGSASADPSNADDNGNGAENSASAQQDNGSDGKSASSSGSLKAESSAESSNAGTQSTDGHSGTSGDVNSPQPISNADANEGGANGQCPGGPYCSTRDGSPSLNGNGGGAATGKPLAGEVGKADNKNPNGQKPDASDHNNGYECDGNNGIAKGNPAHTACQPTTPVCVEDCGNPPPVCVTDCGNPPPPERPRPPTDIGGVETERPPAAVPPASPPAAVLPATGSPELLGFVGGGGMGLLMLGGLMIWLHRRNRVIS